MTKTYDIVLAAFFFNSGFVISDASLVSYAVAASTSDTSCDCACDARFIERSILSNISLPSS